MELTTAWKGIALAALALPQHEKLEVARHTVPHPESAGLYRSRGLARRCQHYRHALPDGRGLHVHEFADRYVVHWDRVDPSISLLRHFAHDVVRALTQPLRPSRTPTNARQRLPLAPRNARNNARTAPTSIP